MPSVLAANALVTLDKAKQQLDIAADRDEENDRVTDMINAASSSLEQTCTRKFIEATYTDYFDGSGTPYLKAYEFPVTQVISANVDDARVFGGGTAISTSDLVILRTVMIVRADGSFWHALRPMNTKVVYKAGYPSNAIPEDLQQACLELVKYLYLTRNDRRTGIATKTKLGENISFVTDQLPPMVEQLIKPHRRANYVANQLQGIILGGTQLQDK